MTHPETGRQEFSGSLAEMERCERMVFELFAQAYPHEASEVNWTAFVEYTRLQCENPDLPESAIRDALLGQPSEK